MNAEFVRVNLRYDQADLESLFRYARAHDVVQAGRYDLRRSPPAQHLDAHLGQSSLPGRIVADVQPRIDRNTASLMSVIVQPGYDWPVFLDELARLEKRRWGMWSMENAGHSR